MTGERTLVTGATGWIGRRIIPFLQQAGSDVHILTRTAVSACPDGVTRHGVDLHGDRRDAEGIDALMQRLRPTRLLHLAWFVAPGDYSTSAENLRWVDTTVRLVEAFAQHGGRRVVAAGTCAEYDWSHGLCSESHTPLAPATLYGECKRRVYNALADMAVMHGFSFAWGRPFFLYGPGEAPDRLVPTLIEAAVSGRTFPLRYPLRQRDYLHVDDAAAAFAALLASDVRLAVNIGSGIAVSLADLARRIAESAGGHLHLEVPDPPLDDDAAVVVADTARLRTDVGWIPARSLADGLRDTVVDWRMHRRTVTT